MTGKSEQKWHFLRTSGRRSVYFLLFKEVRWELQADLKLKIAEAADLLLLHNQRESSSSGGKKKKRLVGTDTESGYIPLDQSEPQEAGPKLNSWQEEKIS